MGTHDMDGSVGQFVDIADNVSIRWSEYAIGARPKEFQNS